MQRTSEVKEDKKTKEAPSGGKLTPKTTVTKAIPTPKAMGVKNETKKEEPKPPEPKQEKRKPEPKIIKSQEIKESAVPSGLPAPEGGYRYSTSREDWTPKEKQLDNLFDMRELSMTARHELWRSLNAGTSEFIRIVRTSEVPKEMRFSYAEALERKLITEKRPHRESLYCPYCGQWNYFVNYSYTGARRCVGCGISDNDFHLRKENGLMKTEQQKRK